jgi:MurNAc alpha-1-phosphate uridylyltransferase
MQNLKTAMLLAAGRGSRMMPLTQSTPKPLLKVGGKPLIEHHLEKLAVAGFERVVINLGWCGEKIPQLLGDGGRYGLEILYSDETDIPGALESAGGIINALPLLGDEPFAVIAADIWSDYDYKNLSLPLGSLAHLIMVPPPAYHPMGDFLLINNSVELKEFKDQKGQCFSSLSAYDPSFFDNWDTGVRPLRELWDFIIPTGMVSGELYQGTWFNVGTPQDLAEVEQHLAVLGS